MRIRPRINALSLLIVVAASAACGNSNLGQNVATMNAAATKAASGEVLPASTVVEDIFGEKPTPEPTAIANLHDLTVDPNGRLVAAWSSVYALSGREAFTIVATQEQVGAFIVQSLRVNGWDATVISGGATIGGGQIRLDLEIVDTTGASGLITVTFQPTLNAAQQVELHPAGGDFGTLKLPNGLTGALGDMVYTALTGAPDDRLSKVTLSLLSLESGQMRLVGVRR